MYDVRTQGLSGVAVEPLVKASLVSFIYLQYCQFPKEIFPLCIPNTLLLLEKKSKQKSDDFARVERKASK